MRRIALIQPNNFSKRSNDITGEMTLKAAAPGLMTGLVALG
jgi:hypothetical protein